MEQRDALVRVCVPGEIPVGAGVLLTPSIVVTCAHVVSQALGHDEVVASAPADPVEVDLPFLPARRRLVARVRRWSPPRPDGGGDLALLDLDASVPVAVPAWRRLPDTWGAPFRVMGFPVGLEEGTWSTGVLRERQGSGWLQLHPDPGTEIGPGFSGAPVWDASGTSVLGLAVTADRLSPEGDAFALPADEVLTLAPELLVNPFPGRRAFTTAEAGLLVGRDAELARCRELLAGAGTAVITAGSGQGATSLLRAGVLAAYADVPSVTDDPDAPAPPHPGTLLVVDRLDEHLLGRSGTEVASWLDERRRAGFRVAGTVRADRWRVWLADEPDLESIGVEIGALDRVALRRAVLEPPGRLPGPSFTADLAARIADEAGGEPGGTALAQGLAHRLWEHATEEPDTDLGGVPGEARTMADLAWTRLTPAQRDVARELLVSLTRVAADGDDGPRALPLAATTALQRDVLEVLARGRVVVIGAGGHDGVELAHRTLVGTWSPLVETIAADRPFLAWRDETRDRAVRWRAAPDDRLLLRGEDLTAARDHVRDRPGDVGDGERALVEASVRRRERDRRRRRIVAIGLAVLLLITGSLAAIVLRSRADAARATAVAGALGRVSLAALATDPGRATQLALAAYRSDPTDPTARSALGQAYLVRRSTTSVAPIVGADDPGAALVPDPDDDVEAVATTRGVQLALDLDGRTPLFDPVPDAAPGDRPVAVTGHGRWVVLRSAVGQLRVWDRRSRAAPRVVGGPPVDGVTATPDGSHLLARTADGSGTSVVRIDLATADEVPLVRLLDPVVDGVWQTRDAGRVLVRTPEGLETRDVRTGQVVVTVPADSGVGLRGAVTVACTGTGADQAVVVTDAATGAAGPRVATGPDGCVTHPPVLSADDGHVIWASTPAGASAIRVLQVVDLADGRRRAAWTASAADPTATTGPGFPTSGRVVVRTGSLTVLDGAGADVLSLSDSPGWRGPAGGTLLKGPDDGVTVVLDATGATAVNSYRGGRLGHVDPPPTGWSSTSVSPGAATFLAVRTAPDGAVVDEYSLPALQRLGEYDLRGSPAAPSGAPAPVVARGTDETVVLAGDVLSWWSPTTHRILAPPVTVGPDPLSIAALNPSLVLATASGARGALRVPDGVVLRSSAATVHIPTGSGEPPAGMLVQRNRLFALEAPDRLTRRDIPGGSVDGLDVTVPLGTDRVLGADSTGRPVTWDPTDGRLDLWAPDDDTGAGTLVLPPGALVGDLVNGRAEVDLGDSALSIGVEAGHWRTHLCQIQDRSFSPAELAALPDGASSIRPCAPAAR